MDMQVPAHPGAVRLYVFDEVYSFRAAQEQAEKKKLGAFGALAKWNPLNRPKPETVLLSRQEMRLEPFWHVVAQRTVEYACRVDYPVPVHNPHAKSVQIGAQSYEVARHGGKGRIDVPVVEQCYRRVDYADYVDGLGREIKAATLAAYVDRYKHAELEALDRPEAVQPRVPMASAIQIAKAKLAAEAINAHEIHEDQDRFEKLHLFFRPVFAFEYVWSNADRRGVIEVDGLTGEVVEAGQWFKDKVNRLVTRETMFELGAEVAGALVPGGGVVVKVFDRMTVSNGKP
ncbi:hypothetical protein BEN78_03440 [Xanthomonas citri pv. mangiferaeindicae]|nr:hypothetical protein BEN78_03440 [Xanthomonas citri pv. mangiferaeindicae]